MMGKYIMQTRVMKPAFVSRIPDRLEDGVLYICIESNSVLHKCACGCGEEVSTPLSPNGWVLIYDGEQVSLKPSIGNWSYKCKSHYWITKNIIMWAEKTPNYQIDKGKEKNFGPRKSFWKRLFRR
jgi:hypothetical protein